jgi:hypothetical protein
MPYNDIIAKNIRKQIALNSGPLAITSKNVAGTGGTGGSLQWVDVNTRQSVAKSGDAGNWLAANSPQIYTTAITADSYNKILGIFQKIGIPDSVLQPLVSAASYYVSQTGADPSGIYNSSTGQLSAPFASVYNALRHPSSQVGVVKNNSTPNWQNNPLLRGNLQEYLP